MANIVKRRPPTLTKVGKRQIISSGRWNDIIIADFILAEGGTRSIEISELAKIGWGHNTKDTKTKARRYLHKVFSILIDRGVLMVTEYEPHRHKAMAVKLFDPNNPTDHQHLRDKMDRMKQRGQLSTERYERAAMLLHPISAQEERLPIETTA